jgi:hypothetical protein
MAPMVILPVAAAGLGLLGEPDVPPSPPPPGFLALLVQRQLLGALIGLAVALVVELTVCYWTREGNLWLTGALFIATMFRLSWIMWDCTRMIPIGPINPTEIREKLITSLMVFTLTVLFVAAVLLMFRHIWLRRHRGGWPIVVLRFVPGVVVTFLYFKHLATAIHVLTNPM